MAAQRQLITSFLARPLESQAIPPPSLVNVLEVLQAGMQQHVVQLTEQEARLRQCEGALAHETLRSAPCTCRQEVQPQLRQLAAAQQELSQRLATSDTGSTPTKGDTPALVVSPGDEQVAGVTADIAPDQKEDIVPLWLKKSLTL